MKPVTRDTFAMLHYAGGSGYARMQPVLDRAEAAVVVDDGADVQPRSAPKRRVVEEKPAEEPALIRNAVRVPLPGEEKVAVAVSQTPDGKPKAKVALMPVPDALAAD